MRTRLPEVDRIFLNARVWHAGLSERLCAQSSNPVVLFFLEQGLNFQGMRVLVEPVQNLILERQFAMDVPFFLERLVGMTPVAQAEPGSVLNGLQVLGCADPDSSSCSASHNERPEKRFAFLEFPDGFFFCFLRLHSGASVFRSGLRRILA